MPIIAPGICRYSVNGTLYGQDCINIIDVEVENVPDRDTAIYLVSGRILDGWCDNVLAALHQNYSFNSVSYVDLDNAGGGTGSRTATADNTLPEFGSNTGGCLPGNTVAVVEKVLAGKTRQQRNGSIRLGGIPEDFTVPGNGNFLTSSAVTGYGEALQALRDAVQTPPAPAAQLVMVHTVAGVYSGHSPIAQLRAKSQVGTQRRRMPGYGT